MNDQIKELAEKAGLDILTDNILEKFAEAIINECALVARWHVLEHNGMSRYYTGNVLVEDAIRNNFKEQQ